VTAGVCIIRADASPAVGGGHVMRCLSLADGLAAAGWRCVFAVAGDTRATVPALAGREIVDLADPLDPGVLMRALPGGADLLVTDHYGIGASYEAACRGWARRILVVDDLANRYHDCDVLLDQTLGRQKADYTRLVPKHVRLLLGPRYAVLRPEFTNMRKRSLEARASRRPGRIVVSAGLTDPFNVTGLLLDAVAGLSLAVDVVIGSICPHLASIRTAARRSGATVHIDCENMAALMADADIALGAPGTTSWERCCLGLPSLLVVLIDNQRINAAALAEAGAAMVLGERVSLAPGHVAAALARLKDDTAALAEMSRRAAAICDGLGVDSVVRIVREAG
jgi:UDP-2,4-diacetamido-2,4,6-trideoxy-beta-L-altropyranose hydrolase